MTDQAMGSFAMKTIGALLVCFSAIASVQAQEANLEEMQRSIDIVSGVLREGLELNTRGGIFSPLNGSVQGDYYMRQGIVLEVVTPLANSRSALNWQSFEGRLQQLAGQISNLVNTPRVSPPDLELLRESMELSLRNSSGAAQQAYNDLLETIRNTDFAKETEQALAQASESALSLHELGKIDDARLNALMQEVSELRAQINARVEAIAQLRSDIGSAQQTAQVDDNVLQDFQGNWEEIVNAMQTVRDAALDQASQLRQQLELAQQEREQQWQQELLAFEQKLFGLVCDYGAALRALPDNEHLTLVLKGLGDEDATHREDRIYVLAKSQLQACMQGTIDADQLQRSALTYSF